MTYIQENFSIGGETGRLIQNILNFAEGEADNETCLEFLSYIFNNTIGLTDEEI